MSTWLNLFKKEFRHGMPALLSSLIGLLVLLVLAIYFGWRGGHVRDALLGTAFILIFPHIFYLTFYMVISLQREKKKLHLWLHNPMPGYKLFLAKFVNGILAMTITLFITSAICLVVYLSYGHVPFMPVAFSTSTLFKLGTLTLLHIYLFAIDFAIWFIFFWVFYRMLVRRLGVFISAVLTIILFGLIAYLLTQFETTVVYDALTHWGKISFSQFISGFEFSSVHGIKTVQSGAYVYFGSYLFEAIIAVILYFASSWILDRKVEV